MNLNYLDPDAVDIPAYEADPDTFVEPHAGEVLYRLRTPGFGVEPANRTADNHPHPGWTADSLLDLDRSGAAPSFPGCLSARSRNIRDL